MKPVSVTMCAFGSYGKKQTIDFTKPVQNLFLVTGDTGAGKSTIFDAIVFALYGEASSSDNKKSGEELYSQFVEPGVEPFVELEFEEEDEIYVVRREPRHYKLKKNGERKATAETEKVSFSSPCMRECSGKEANQKIIEIVGLTKEQFMQVAMIAQGEFMKLLRESSDKKRDVFRKLFGTGIFQDIVEELNRRKKETGTEMAILHTESKKDISNIIIPENMDNFDELQKDISFIINEKQYNVPAMERLLDRLLELCKVIEDEKGKLDTDYAKWDKKYEEKSQELARADQLVKSYDLLAKAEEILAECEKKKSEIKKTEVLCKQIEIAYDLKVDYDLYKREEKKLSEKKDALQSQEKKLPELEKEFANQKEQRKKALEEKNKSDELFTKTSERVEKALDAFRKLEDLQQKLSQMAEKRKRTEEACQSAKTEMDSFEQKEKTWRAKEKELSFVDVALAELDARKKSFADLKSGCVEYNKNNNSLAIQKTKVQNAINDYNKSSTVYEEKSDEYEKLRKQFLDNQAGILAEELRQNPGTPCPVCGSLEHPQLRIIDISKESIDKDSLNQDSLEMMAKELEELRTQQENLSSEVAAQKGLLEGLLESQKNEWSKLFSKFSDMNICLETDEYDVKEVKEKLHSYEKDLLEEENQLREKAVLLEKIRKSLQGADEKKEELAKIFEEKEKDIKTCDVQISGHMGKVEEVKQAVVDFKNRESAENELKQATQAKDSGNELWEKTDLAFSKAKQLLDECKILIENYRTEIPAIEEELQKSLANYKNHLQKSSCSEEDWINLTDCYSKEDIGDFREEVNQFTITYKDAKNKKETALTTIGNQKKPQLVILQSECEELKEKRNKIQEQKVAFVGYFSQNTNVYKSLSAQMSSHGKLMKENQKLQSLYSRLSGNEKNHRMDIETFAQRYYLGRILDAANDRFLNMSGGEYELRMYDAEKAGEGKNRGLDLMVYSNVTGQEREVRTLSGGESFMAALSLALGMADEIQAKSSAINLDIMFIDEGFGSLDDRARNEAVKVLKSMADGSKMIGIISHVTELKQEIEDLLIVTKDDDGSHTSWKNS